MHQSLIIKHFSELSALELFAIVRARQAVFIEEQHIVSVPELDDTDLRCIHLCLIEDGQIVAYARMFEESEPGVWHIGRVLTRRRGEGLGIKIMQEAELYAQHHGGILLRLSSQGHAKKFYEKLGYKIMSDIYMEANIEHVLMEKKIIT